MSVTPRRGTAETGDQFSFFVLGSTSHTLFIIRKTKNGHGHGLHGAFMLGFASYSNIQDLNRELQTFILICEENKDIL